MGPRALVTTLLGVALLAAIGALAVPRVIDAAQSLGDEPEDESFLPKARGGPDTPPPAGLQRGSLVLRGNLVPALRRLKARSGGGRVRVLRVAPDRVEAQVVTADDRLRTLQHRWTGETQMLSDTSAPAAGRPTFAWADIDASAPRRLAEHAVRGRSARELRSLVLADDGAGPRWSAFLSGGGGFTAEADGRDARPSGR